MIAMAITRLERAVIERFLQDPQLHPLKAHINFDSASVMARDLTGVGFLTHFAPSNATRLFGEGATFRWGQVGARLNFPAVETGYVVYVDNGYLTTIEGYTYGDDWPEQINSIELYELKLGTEIGQTK